MTAHLKEKVHWINEQNSLMSRKSFGMKVVSLPVQCVISAAIVEELARQQNSRHITVCCCECYTKFDCEVWKANGNPQNIALIGRWDGWQPFSMTSKHSSGKHTGNSCTKNIVCIYIYMCMHVCVVVHCLPHKFNVAYIGAIKVSIATMYKTINRSKCEEV